MTNLLVKHVGQLLVNLGQRLGMSEVDVEGVAAASTHPGDWRYANFDYD
jgi:hypothetical protein